MVRQKVVICLFLRDYKEFNYMMGVGSSPVKGNCRKAAKLDNYDWTF